MVYNIDTKLKELFIMPDIILFINYIEELVLILILCFSIKDVKYNKATFIKLLFCFILFLSRL